MICSNCKVDMKKAVMNAATGGVLYIANDEKADNKLFYVKKSSKVNCFCCPECGKIELYAADVTLFKDNKDE